MAGLALLLSLATRAIAGLASGFAALMLGRRALAQPALLDFLGLALRAPSGEPVDLLAPPPVDLLNAPLEAPPMPPPQPVFEEAVV